MEKTSPFPRKPRCRLGGDSVTTKKMAKRRERRVAPCSDRPKKRGESSNREQFGDSATDRRLITIFVIFFIVIPVVFVFLYYVKFSPRSSRGVYHVHQRGVIKTDVSYQEILTENSEVSENVSYCHYKYPVLAYITPWNSKGYEMAKKFNSKFTHLSPFWYDLKRKMEYDGIVLESWSRWAVHGILHDPDMRNMISSSSCWTLAVNLSLAFYSYAIQQILVFEYPGTRVHETTWTCTALCELSGK